VGGAAAGGEGRDAEAERPAGPGVAPDLGGHEADPPERQAPGLEVMTS